jgi:DNA recombination protein RmuC
MDTSFYILITTLIVTIVILIRVFRSNSIKVDPQLQKSITDLQGSVSKIEANLKDDFRVNREENATIAKDNRVELNNTLKDFKSELSTTLKNITDQSQGALSQINLTLSERIEALMKRVDENNTANRETLTSNLKDFTLEQRSKFAELKLEQKDLTTNTVENLEKINIRVEQKLTELNEQSKNDNTLIRQTLTSALKDFTLEQRAKFDELKQEQKDLTKNTVEQLEKITGKVEERLTALSEQAKGDNTLMRDALINAFKGFRETFDDNIKSFNELQREKFAQMDVKQNDLVKSTETKLESIRITVEEKLEKTLSDRLGQSFETVGKQLIEVQKGLGEMQTLAQDVGGLKRVLTNVKMRGGFGEVQLHMMLESILAPEQYEANVATKNGSSDRVEFAVKFPNKEGEREFVWLPIDAKFPKDAYENLQTAYDTGDLQLIEDAQKNLEGVIRKMAKDICGKYLDAPNTTNFGIMFLPFEGLFAEVVRKASLLEEIQRECNIVITGPTTLAVILNSLQMGFRTLAIQKRSSEVWKILSGVKKEFNEFGGLLGKAQGHIQTGLNQLDDVIGKRTRAIQRQLKGVEALKDVEGDGEIETLIEQQLVQEDAQSKLDLQ